MRVLTSQRPGVSIDPFIFIRIESAEFLLSSMTELEEEINFSLAGAAGSATE